MELKEIDKRNTVTVLLAGKVLENGKLKDKTKCLTVFTDEDMNVAFTLKDYVESKTIEEVPNKMRYKFRMSFNSYYKSRRPFVTFYLESNRNVIEWYDDIIRDIRNGVIK